MGIQFISALREFRVNVSILAWDILAIFNCCLVNNGSFVENSKIYNIQCPIYRYPLNYVTFFGLNVLTLSWFHKFEV